jgi:tRNA pseudouridine55 synthase
MSSWQNIILSRSNLGQLDFENGVVMLIDKPLGWTSFDAVKKLRSALRYNLGLKKIKVGHAGTLDPLATGLLIVCTGKMTKRIDEFQAQSKVYSGHFVLGATTPTYDSEVEPTEFFETSHIDSDLIEKARLSFIGEIMQVPPLYSAIKIDGTKAYELARRGREDVELKARAISIYDFKFQNQDIRNLQFTMHCSKGTYVRSLAFDFGRECNSGAFLGALRRDAIGDFLVTQALSIVDAVSLIEQKAKEDNLNI